MEWNKTYCKRQTPARTYMDLVDKYVKTRKEKYSKQSFNEHKQLVERTTRG
jgi:hypothetical protein